MTARKQNAQPNSLDSIVSVITNSMQTASKEAATRHQELRDDMKEMKQELKGDIKAVENEAATRHQELRDDMKEMEKGLKDDIKAVENEAATRHQELRDDIKEMEKGLKDDMTQMEKGLKGDIKAVEDEAATRHQELRGEMKEMSERVTLLQKDIHGVEVRLGERMSNVEGKMSLVVWLLSVLFPVILTMAGALAGLYLALGRLMGG